jgi:phosphoserine aminotransferase
VTQNETSTGLWIPENQISEIANRYPDKLMLVDVVSSIPVVQLEWEKVDLAYWSVQKGFQLPAGLAVVVMSPRAIQRCQALTLQQSCGAYHSLAQLAANSEKNITAETPNVLAIYLLKRAIQKYLSSGLESIRTETLARATRFYEQLNYTPFRALVTSKEFQSPTVFAVVSDADISTWRANLTSQHQMYTGACYSELKPHAFRIANFPIHTEEEHSAILNQMKLFTA